MRKFCAVLLAASGSFACVAPAQVTNVPPTELEAFEAQTGTVIVKGAGQIGSLAVGAVNVTVFSKESTDVSTGRKEYGMVIEMVDNQQEWRRVVDYDELASLLSGLDYISRIDYNVTTLPTFIAGYTTKSGFRVGALTNQRHGTIQFFLQAYNAESPRVLISPAQLVQFQTLIEQTRKDLDALRTPR